MSHISTFPFYYCSGFNYLSIIVVGFPEGKRKQKVQKSEYCNVKIPGNFLKGSWNNVDKDV